MLVLALNATVTDILRRLSSSKAHADSLLVGVSGIMNRTYENEVRQADEEYQKAQGVSALAVSARFNVTAHQNLTKTHNDTAIELEGNLKVSYAEFNRMGNRVVTIHASLVDAINLINQTKVFALHR